MGMPISLALRGTHLRDERAEGAWQAALAELRWVDAVFSTWRADSQVSRLGRGELTLGECDPAVAEVMRLEGVQPAEREAVLAAVRLQFGLEPAEAEELVRLAEAEAKDAHDYYQFTSLIRQHYPQEDRQAIVELLWRVAYADSRLTTHEMHVVRKIADLLYVPHSAYIAAKMRAVGRSGDLQQFLELDIQYHTLVLAASGNEMFAQMHSMIAEVLRGRTDYGLMPTHPHEEALQLHVDVADAIQSGRPEAARQAMDQIMRRTIEEVRSVWDDEPRLFEDADA